MTEAVPIADEMQIELPRATGSDIARYILATTGKMSHLKLQKLLYYIDAWHLAFFDQPLFEESFEAWLHGPVLRPVWNEYRDVSILHNEIPPENNAIVHTVTEALLPEQVEMISDVLAEYGDKTAYHLECLTHAEKPWVEARQGVPDGSSSSNVISKEMTRRYYQARLS